MRWIVIILLISGCKDKPAVTNPYPTWSIDSAYWQGYHDANKRFLTDQEFIKKFDIILKTHDSIFSKYPIQY